MSLIYTDKITVIPVQQVGGDAMVVAAARVSTSGEEALRAAESSRSDRDYGLISYLMQYRHGSPFEHSSLTFFVHAPIFVWREWHRHRTMSFNEESARYRTLEPVFYLPPSDRPLMKVEGWQPGRPKFLRCEADRVYEDLCDSLRSAYEVAYAAYERNLALGVDPGIARACLPVGIYSSCWVTCNLRSLMHFLSLRTHEPAAAYPSYPLYEIEVAARACAAVLAEGWPLTYRAFCAHGRVAP